MAQEKFYFNQSDSPFKEFSEEKTLQILKEYYNLSHIVKYVEDKYDIKSHLRRKMPFVITDEKCKFCQHYLYDKPKRKAGGHEPYRVCSNCGHKEDDWCNCLGCKAIQNKKEEQRLEDIANDKQKIKEEWKEIHDTMFIKKYYFDNISIYDKIDLSILFDKLNDKRNDTLSFYTSMLKTNGSNDYKSISKELDRFKKIANRLFQSELLIPSYDTRIEKDSTGVLIKPNILSGDN